MPSALITRGYAPIARHRGLAGTLAVAYKSEHCIPEQLAFYANDVRQNRPALMHHFIIYACINCDVIKQNESEIETK